jgi:hypothetical protein
MKSYFWKHAWLGFIRSPALTQNIIQTIFMVFFGLYIAVSLIFLGFVGGDMIREYFPGANVISVATALLFYYFATEIIVRYIFQKFPAMAIRPYLLLPVPKKAMAHHLLLRSLPSFYNFLPLFFILPFYFTEVLPTGNSTLSTGFLIFATGFILFSNFAAFGISKALDLKRNAVGLVLIFLVGFVFLEYNGYTHFFPYLQALAERLISNPVLWLIPIGLPVATYLLLHKYFSRNISTGTVQSHRKAIGGGLGLSWFDRFGMAGKLMDLELRLMLRSKRARSYLLMSVLILAFPLVFFDSGEQPEAFQLILTGLFASGMIALNHGQLMLSWNSEHFDLLLTRGNTIKDIFRAKYYILVLSCVICYLLFLPWVFFIPDLFIFNTALLLINCSFSIMIYMLLASVNSLKIDPNEGGAFSMSGFGVAHYLIGVPIVLVPMLLFYSGAAIGGRMAGVAFMAAFGLAGVIFHKFLINWSVSIFMKNRYKISSAFRA